MTPQDPLLLFAAAEVSLAVLFGGLYLRLSRVYRRSDLVWWTQSWSWLFVHVAALAIDDAVRTAGDGTGALRAVSAALLVASSTLGLRALWLGIRAFKGVVSSPRLQQATLVGTVVVAALCGVVVGAGLTPPSWSLALPHTVRAAIAYLLAAVCTHEAWDRRASFPGAMLTTSGLAALTVAQANYTRLAVLAGLHGQGLGAPFWNAFDWMIWTMLGVGAITWLIHDERAAADAAARARAALQDDVAARERRLDAIVNGIADRILILDGAGRIAYGGRPDAPPGTFTSAELEGQPMEAFAHPDDATILHDAFRRLTAAPDAVTSETIRVRTKAGGWLIYECHGRNLLHDPSVRGILITARDITERVRLEGRLRDAQRMESIGRLAGGIAHDFNNLLTVIAGNADLAREHLAPGAPGDDEIAQIEAAADRATTLTRQLLAFARRQVVKPALVDPGAVLMGMEALLRRLAGGHIEMTLRIDERRPLVLADRIQLEQVVLNLVANARDAMPEGGRLTLTTATVLLGADDAVGGLPPGEYVTLAVADTGAGLSAEARAHVFEPFFTTKAVGEGTGLGLASCYGIAAQHGGTVVVESERGRGATFTLYLPRAEGVAPDVVVDPVVTRTVGRERVLLVEDDPDVRRVAVRALQTRGFDVIEASDGEVAWRVLQEDREVACLVTDVAMPVLGGTALVRRIRGLGMPTPVVFTSGYTNEETLAALIDRRTVFVPKPYSAETLAARVRALIDDDGHSRDVAQR